MKNASCVNEAGMFVVWTDELTQRRRVGNVRIVRYPTMTAAVKMFESCPTLSDESSHIC